VAEFLCTGFLVTKRRACQVLSFARSCYYYRGHADPQVELRMRLKDLAGTRVRYGYRRLHVLLMREGWAINHKRVYRLYKQEGLSLRLKTKKKRASEARVPPPAALAPLECWSMDFVADRLSDGRQIRMLTLVDNFSRVSPAIEVDFSLTGKRVVEVLERLKKTCGLPKVIRVDNGSEFISKAMDEWAYRNGVKLEFSRPGKPTDNAFIESFNGRLRQECLQQNWFISLDDAKGIVEDWREDYNEERPHSSLRQQTPSEFMAQWQQLETVQKAEILTLETVQL
jgi:putative transposase